MTCQDGLLWIGQSYVDILCGEAKPSTTYCFLDRQGKPKRCFVHEAERRGCCRKVPRKYDWLKPGRSHIFLVHRSNIKDRAHGLLFGYFLLKRFEIITSAKVHDAIVGDENIPWIEEVALEIEWEVLEKIEDELEGGLFGKHKDIVRDWTCQQFNKQWENGLQRQLGKGVCITPRPKPVKPVEISWPEAEDTVDNIFDILEDLIENLIDEWLQRDEDFKKIRNQTYDSDQVTLPLEVTAYEGHRSCSKRLKVGSVYLVDGLTAAITDLFLLNLAKIKSSTIKQGELLFEETISVVKKERKPGRLTKIDKRLAGNATLRGELVLLKKPYPIFEREPQAAFRGLIRVEGDQLINEIAKTYQDEDLTGVIDIPYCLPTKDKAPIWVPARFAEKFHLSKSTAEAILQLYTSYLKELKPGEKLDLPHIGVFSAQDDELRFTPY